MSGRLRNWALTWASVLLALVAFECGYRIKLAFNPYQAGTARKRTRNP